MTLIDEMPEDQRKLILHRLGSVRVKQIEATIEDGPKPLPAMASGDKIRPEARMTYSVGRFYQASLREMGPNRAKMTVRDEPPTPANAWLEVTTAIDKGLLIEPTFSHKYIADTIQFFRGWSAMWAEFNKVQGQTARGRFIFAYKDVIQGTVK